jgi:hypothetical protein
MATTPATLGTIPAGFVSPFKRVQQDCRIEDAFACCSMLCNRTLLEVNKMAVTLGYPAHGPAWVEENLIAALLFNLGELKAHRFAEFTSFSALPDVCLLMVDYVESVDTGRLVLFHHVRGTGTQQAFSYIIDPADWIDPKHHITTSVAHLKLEPAWYIEVTPRAGLAPKAK